MRWGFLGIGRVTPRMVQAVRDAGHSIVMGAARDAEALRRWGELHQVHGLTTDFNSVCESPDVDAIYVALPPSLHLQYAAHAIQSGKHVLCEKPLTVHARESEQIAALKLSSDQCLLHATAFPFHPRSQEIRRRVLCGMLGEIKRVTVACTFSHVMNRGKDYRTNSDLGGGSLLDLGWYAAFATMWLTGQTPRSIQGVGRRAEGSSEDEPGVWVSNQALVELSGGAIAHWDCGFDVPGRKWIEIAGTQGSIVCDDFLRPWDPDRPRFWVHGAEGKAEEVVCGAGCNQEVEMVKAATASRTAENRELFKLGVTTQQVLEQWQDACQAEILSSLA